MMRPQGPVGHLDADCFYVSAGRFALRSAATLHLAGVYRDPSNEWDICDVRQKMYF